MIPLMQELSRKLTEHTVPFSCPDEKSLIVTTTDPANPLEVTLQLGPEGEPFRVFMVRFGHLNIAEGEAAFVAHCAQHAVQQEIDKWLARYEQAATDLAADLASAVLR